MATEKKKVGLTIQIVLALLAGVGLGVASPELALRLSWLGEIFMAALMMLIMPLILVTMISGVGSLGDPEELGRMGARTILYYTATTFAAIVVGLVIVNVMRPGETTLPAALQKHLMQTHSQLGVIPKQESKKPTSQPASATSQAVLSQKTDLLGQRMNAFEALFLKEVSQRSGQLDSKKQARAKALSHRARQELEAIFLSGLGLEKRSRRLEGRLRTELIYAQVGVRRGLKAAHEMRAESREKGPKLTIGSFLRAQIKKVLQNPFQALTSGNVLGVIVFALFLGLILVRMGEQGRMVLDLAGALNEAMMRFVVLVMKLTPVGVFSLMATQVARSGLDILFLLAKYMLCVITALLLHAVVVLPLVLWIFGRVSPLRFFMQVRDALSVAFSTSSSSATLPVSLEVVEEKAGVPGRVAGFVLPLGATVNMDGTALYEAIAAMFIAQLYGIDLGLGPQILIFLTAGLAAVGAAGIPSAGTVTMVMVLAAVGLPISGIGLILAVDRLLDMCRTTVNVWGDLIGAAILARFEPDDNATSSSK
ncbi:MAG: dicarboxylate/amino acid:cation symporter [Myxococcales bacterium]|nr:dicarboxylate/amino acid:cation symporter [Myxococcales bacterium]